MKINNMEEVVKQLSKGKVMAKAESGDKESGNKTKTQSGWSVVPVLTKSITCFWSCDCITSSPFETFCWMPRVQAVDIFCNLPSGEKQMERRYEMAQDDISKWKHRESLISNAAQILRLQYKISSNIPPLPSSFHYDKPHKTVNVLSRPRHAVSEESAMRIQETAKMCVENNLEWGKP